MVVILENIPIIKNRFFYLYGENRKSSLAFVITFLSGLIIIPALGFVSI